MSIQTAINSFMNDNQIVLCDDDIVLVGKIRTITSRGNSAEVKRTTNGGYTVYEVKKEKR